MALNAKLALLLLLIFCVAGDELSGLAFNSETSLQEDYTGNKQGRKFDFSFKSGFVIGYAFSSVSVVSIFLSYCVPWASFKKRNKKIIMATPMMTSLMATREKKREKANRRFSEFENLTRRMSFMELNDATNSFDQGNIIGVGKMGTMYKATHPRYGFIAVKRLQDSQHLEEQFKSELMILGRYGHINIIPLMGFCVESKERLLVYKYMPNGNLYDWLHPMKAEAKILDWHLKVKIAIGVARGLAWLHHNKPLIVHRNISSNCILLDKNFEPKISNFKRSMLISPNAMDILVNRGVDLTKKDVYKFGILLLELITRQYPINKGTSSHSLEVEALVERFAHLSTNSPNLDKSLMGQQYNCKILHFLKIARDCIQPIPNKRPTMLEVFKMLMTVKEINGQTTDSEILAQTDDLISGDHNIQLKIIEIQ